MRRNDKGESMVEHHVKYKEIHGVDETVWMTRSEHTKLHIRLRKEGKCKVPSDILHNISCAAAQRTNKCNPSLSIYVNDKIYQHLGEKPSKTGKLWIEDRYRKETETKGDHKCIV